MDGVQGRIHGGGGMGPANRYVMSHIISYQITDNPLTRFWYPNFPIVARCRPVLNREGYTDPRTM